MPIKNFRIYLSIVVIFLLFNLSNAKSQTNETIFVNEIGIINTCIDSLKNVTNDSIKEKLNELITVTLSSILRSSNSFNMNLDSLKHIGKVYSTDDKFRVVSWNIPLSDGTHKFNAIIQLNPEKDSFCKLFVLKDSSPNFKGSIANISFTADKWYGALYYEILTSKIDKKNIYILLGMHFNDLFTNRKIIESMYFDENGKPVFGYPVFKNNGKLQSRIVFDYSVNAVMNLKYEKRMQMIIFDHLAPPSPLYAGNYKFYGPDFSFDGLKFEKNKWVYYPNIDYRKSKK